MSCVCFNLCLDTEIQQAELQDMLIDRKMKHNWLTTFGRFIILMGRTFSVPERFRMFWKQYVKEMSQLGIDSIGIVLLISFFIGAVICIQMKLNIQSPWMPRWVSGYYLILKKQ